ncbi:MAG: porin [Thalassotalea sp.]|nr:porin [Thalassotalea sp.]
MRKSTLAVVIGTGMLTATPALADVTAYGRVTYNVINDDTSKDTYFGRHEFAESTIGIKGSMAYGELKIGGQVEIGLDEGVSNILHAEGNGRTRIQELWLSGDFGKVKLGTGAGITWVISDVDQSGTWFSDPLGMSQRFGATRRGPGGESQTPFVQAQSIFNERLIYESPSFIEGAKAYVQLSEAGGYELAIKYVADAWRINAWSVDYGDIDRDEDPQANIDEHTTNGFFGADEGHGVLAGYKHESGINFTATYGNASQVSGGEREFLNWKLGYTQGKHAVSFSMGNYSADGADGNSLPDHTRSTLAYNFKPIAGIQLWLQATQGDTDSQEEFNALALGGMVKF